MRSANISTRSMPSRSRNWIRLRFHISGQTRGIHSAVNNPAGTSPARTCEPLERLDAMATTTEKRLTWKDFPDFVKEVNKFKSMRAKREEAKLALGDINSGFGQE